MPSVHQHQCSPTAGNKPLVTCLWPPDASWKDLTESGGLGSRNISGCLGPGGALPRRGGSGHAAPHSVAPPQHRSWPLCGHTTTSPLAWGCPGSSPEAAAGPFHLRSRKCGIWWPLGCFYRGAGKSLASLQRLGQTQCQDIRYMRSMVFIVTGDLCV